ncbi:MAG: hypothetical protein ACJAY8_001029 [Sphingobacteriales bacterium]|jgi:hypothetical protein
MKRLIYFGFLIVLLLPLGQYAYEWFDEEPLKGLARKQKMPDLFTETFLEGEFQEQFGDHMRDSIGFRPFFIRTINQFDYSLFNQINIENLEEGKDGYLFGKIYLDTYLGKDLVAEKLVEAHARKVVDVKDSLAVRNIQLVYSFVPGKVMLYPEFMPSDFGEKKQNNYELFCSTFDTEGVDYLDFYPLLKRHKDAGVFPVFPQAGLHWSAGVVAKAASYLFDELGGRLNKPMVNWTETGQEWTQSDYRETDYDYGESLNLFTRVSQENMMYPTVKFTPYDSAYQKPKSLLVGDSFMQSFWLFYPFFENAFHAKSTFWYYNRKITWSPSGAWDVPRKFANMEKELRELDLIYIQVSDENLKKMSFGFIDDLHDYFHGTHQGNEVEVQKLMEHPQVIYKAKKWLKDYKGYTMDEMVRGVAESSYQDTLRQFKGKFEDRVQQVVESIMKNKKWLNKIKADAIRKQIPLEKAIRENAEWFVTRNG